MNRALLSAPAALFRSRADLILENVALCRQRAVFKDRNPQPRLFSSDRLFWIALRLLWPQWRWVLVVVRSEAVVRWHRLAIRTPR